MIRALKLGRKRRWTSKKLQVLRNSTMVSSLFISRIPWAGLRRGLQPGITNMHKQRHLHENSVLSGQNPGEGKIHKHPVETPTPILTSYGPCR
jgi:hypothetical protein